MKKDREDTKDPSDGLKELRERVKKLYMSTHYSVDIGGHKVMVIKEILPFIEAVENLIHQERQKAYEKGFIDGSNATGEQAAEIHAIELEQERQRARKEGFEQGVRAGEEMFRK